MRRIIGIVIASLMFANIGFAEMRILESTTFAPFHRHNKIYLATVCIDGYKFIIHEGDYEKGAGGPIQFYEVGGTSPNRHMALPAKC